MADGNVTGYNIPGNYVLDSIAIQNFDKSESVEMRAMVQKMVIEESIMSSAVHGFIDVLDTDGLHVDLPIFGQETLTLKYSTENSDKYPSVKRTFRIYKMGSKIPTNLNAVTYKLYFVSEELIKSESTKIQKSYRNQAISDIVNDVFLTVKGEVPINVEPTVNTQRIVVPYMSPFKTLNWLSTFAVTGKTQNTSFLFYQDKDAFQFVSVQSLLEKPSKGTFERVPVKNKEVTGDFKDRSIQKMIMNQMFDNLTTLSEGAFGSTVQIYDHLTRTYKTQTYRYDSDYDTRKYLETGTFDTSALFTKDAEFLNPLACRKFIISSTSQVDSSYIQNKQVDNEVFSKKREESLNARLSQILQLSQIKIHIDVPGDSSLTCGDVIDLKVPSYGIETKQKPNDQYYTGRYLIQSIRHVFDGMIYTCELELLKDSVNSTHKNTPSNDKGSSEKI